VFEIIRFFQNAAKCLISLQNLFLLFGYFLVDVMDSDAIIQNVGRGELSPTLKTGAIYEQAFFRSWC
jgi:hypothetical protein